MRWSNGEAAVERLLAAGHVERVQGAHVQAAVAQLVCQPDGRRDDQDVLRAETVDMRRNVMQASSGSSALSARHCAPCSCWGAARRMAAANGSRVEADFDDAWNDWPDTEPFAQMMLPSRFSPQR